MSEPAKRYYKIFSDNMHLQSENARLKAEVERLQNNCDYLDQKLDEQLDKSAMLCGQIERLTDAITSGNAITPDAKPHA
jgi:peptidoglycan hydrolase CwlO-like protein